MTTSDADRREQARREYISKLRAFHAALLAACSANDEVLGAYNTCCDYQVAVIPFHWTLLNRATIDRWCEGVEHELNISLLNY